ncbi:hypothetical protein [Marilutibacter maris]|uniref:hypothetical protein n=1 Tax=Marilutibacter maris TaxID=1605891 RepID=UPI0011AE6F19|nr:hypothetical protein [Lysobacter maris]
MATESVATGPDFHSLYLGMRKIRAITASLDHSDYLETHATRNELCGLLDAIGDIAMQAFDGPSHVNSAEV